MVAPEPDERAPVYLMGCLGAVHRTQSLLLVDWEQTCRGDAAFLTAFRRWEELLAALRLHLLRSEGRLRHLVASGSEVSDYRGPRPDRDRLSARWILRFTEWFALIRVDPTYRHLESVLDGDAEVVSADIVTDLAIVAEVMESAMPALARLGERLDEHALADLAFTQVIAPWRARGLNALHQVERWLAETLSEHGDW